MRRDDEIAGGIGFDLPSKPAKRHTTKCRNCGARMRALRIRVCWDCRKAAGYGALLLALIDVVLRVLIWWL